MITIVAKFKLKSGEKANFIRTAKNLIASSKQEEGCISYNLHEDINDENIMTFIEEWEDKQAIDFHNNTKHFKLIVPKLNTFQEKPAEINLYTKI